MEGGRGRGNDGERRYSAAATSEGVMLQILMNVIGTLSEFVADDHSVQVLYLHYLKVHALTATPTCSYMNSYTYMCTKWVVVTSSRLVTPGRIHSFDGSSAMTRSFENTPDSTRLAILLNNLRRPLRLMPL